MKYQLMWEELKEQLTVEKAINQAAYENCERDSKVYWAVKGRCLNIDYVNTLIESLELEHE